MASRRSISLPPVLRAQLALLDPADPLRPAPPPPPDPMPQRPAGICGALWKPPRCACPPERCALLRVLLG